MKKIAFLFWSVLFVFTSIAQSSFIATSKVDGYSIAGATILVDAQDDGVVKKAATLLQQDLLAVTGKKSEIKYAPENLSGNVVIIGSLEKSALLQSWKKSGKLSFKEIDGKWEAYSIQTAKKAIPGVSRALVIAGSDRRGAAFGVFELSKRIGVSPWYWWADVAVKKQVTLFINEKVKLADAPKVKYRGIFINDEAPALSNWSREKFGGFNHLFYAKVFELMLRLKSNYIWPAMWGNAFYDDDSLNIKTADEYGIVIGTSHHEPLMRAHDEWRRYGNKQKWNYDSTEAGLKEFWKTGMQRAWNEKIVSVGMRGDGDEPMSRETATALLERIVKDQRQIIAEVTGKPAEQTPQLWALYKEVQDYYDKGMRVPDDITLLLCDDNWGNLRKLPKPDAPSRKGGYGIYYHFDYVGGPRNYKWINTNPLPRIWEQMHLAYEHHVKDIWIVNVGDIKPMELPISFFLDYAWNPDRISADDVKPYTVKWATQQFGKKYALNIADLLSKYAKYNSRRKPELLDDTTFSFNYHEWERVVGEYNLLLNEAERINTVLQPESKDAFFQLVLHPIKACANLYDMYFYTALNKEAYKYKQEAANEYANKVKLHYDLDSMITLQYHQLNNGKWNHMMSQTHIGYTYWQQPNRQKVPEVKYVSADSVIPAILAVDSVSVPDRSFLPKQFSGNIFYESEGYVSIEAAHFSKAVAANGITWKVLPDHGRTGDAMTPMPVNAPNQLPGGKAPHLQYEVYLTSSGKMHLQVYCSPSLNFKNAPAGLQYAVSIDDEVPQIIRLNGEDKNSISGIWNKWVAENIIIKTSSHIVSKPGKHIIKFWMVDAGVVLQKLVLNTGGLKPSYLGPPETLLEK
jgi:hypothetical protein